MRTLRRGELKEINFTGGINAWNLITQNGTDSLSTAYRQSHPMNRREIPEGYMDDILNMDFDGEGNLIQRGNFFPKSLSATYGPDTAKTQNAYILTKEGYYAYGRNTYLACVVDTPNKILRFYEDNDTTPFCDYNDLTWVGGRLTGLWYQDYWYVFKSTGNTNQFKISQTGVVTTFTSSLAGGNTGVRQVMMWKDRAWAISGGSSNVSYSKATDPTLWDTANDGGYFALPNKATVVDFIVFNDLLYILDNSNNLWVFVYYTSPGVDGVLRQIITSSQIPVRTGVVSTTRHANKLVVSNDTLFLAGGTNIYQVVNDTIYPIADQLHLEMASRDGLEVHNLGYGILVVSYFDGSSKNPLFFVYHHNTKAFTRYTLTVNSGGNGHWIDTGCLIQGTYSTTFACTFAGSPTTGQGANAYFPIMHLEFNTFFGESRVDGYMGTWDGSNTIYYKSVSTTIKTGPLYMGSKHMFKKFREIMIDAWVGYRQSGDAPQLTPIYAQVQYIPTAMTDKTDTTAQVLDPTQKAEYAYRFPINQRARAIQFTFQRYLTSSWTTHQELPTAGEEVEAPWFVSGIHVAYTPVGADRGKLANATANTDAGTI